jgi:hypothetical protein
MGTFFVVLKNNQGQAITEYILMVAIVVGSYLIIANGIAKMGLAQKIMANLLGPFAAAYRYGHPLAKGYDDGGPVNHPRAVGGENNFRLFFNPRFK